MKCAQASFTTLENFMCNSSKKHAFVLGASNNILEMFNTLWKNLQVDLHSSHRKKSRAKQNALWVLASAPEQ